MKRVWKYIVTMWQPAGLILLSIAIILGLFVYQIGTLVPGSSAPEIAGQTSSQSINIILKDPVNAPYKTARYLARKVHNKISSERLVSGAVAGLAIILFYMVVRHFCSRYAALLAAIMFANSTSLLTYGRMATPNILLLVLLALLSCGYHLRFNIHKIRSVLITAVVVALSLYVPGMIYFIVAGALWQFNSIKHNFKTPKPYILGASLGIMILLLVPLIYGFARDPSLWREYFGLPANLPTIVSFLKSLAAVPYGIFIAAPINSLYRLGRQPMLDIFASFMFIIGCYTLVKRYKLNRLVLLLAIFVITAVFTAISGNYENSFILLPFVYFCIAIGIGTLLDDWQNIFPFNPLAKGLSIGVIAVAVIISVNFQARRYFIAWPHNQATRSVFNLR